MIFRERNHEEWISKADKPGLSPVLEMTQRDREERQYPVCAYYTPSKYFRHPKIHNFLSTSCLIISHLENEERAECRTTQDEVGIQISKALTLLSFLKLRREVPHACVPWRHQSA